MLVELSCKANSRKKNKAKNFSLAKYMYSAYYLQGSSLSAQTSNQIEFVAPAFRVQFVLEHLSYL